MVNTLSIQQYNHLVAHPNEAEPEHLPMIERIIERYPYLASAHILKLAILVKTKDVRAEAEAEHAVVYAASPSELYHYVKKAENGECLIVKGSYFDTLQKLEKQASNSNKSLKELARELAEAQHYGSTATPHDDSNIGLTESHEVKREQSENVQDEELAKYREAIKNNDIQEAIKRLSEINLHNPKKIAYFAEQKRYLELVAQIISDKQDK